jgi:hypothetical protein
MTSLSGASAARVRRRLATAPVALALLQGCSASPLPLSNDSAPIVGGIVDEGDPGVGFLVFRYPDGDTTVQCSASLIAPRIALTAGHCVQNFFLYTDWGHTAEGIGGLRLSFATHPVYDDATNSKIVQMWLHPDLDDSVWAHDFAILVLDQPVATAPVSLRSDALDASLVGQAVRIVGFGQTSGDDTTSVGTKRQATTVIAGLSDIEVNLGSSQQGICFGDSGGPSFIQIGSAEVEIGVHSHGPKSGWKCTTASLDARVDTHMAWIGQFVTADPDQLLSGAINPGSKYGALTADSVAAPAPRRPGPDN